MAAKKILLVDDERDLRDLLTYNLEREGYLVHAAHDGDTALALAAQHRPDLVILDILMPGMNGIEVCHRIRQHPDLRLTPILLLTALNEEKNEIAGLDAGADDYMPKPISTRRLLSRVRALLRRIDTQPTNPERLHIHNLEIDRERYLVLQTHPEGVRELRLPRKEFELLAFLATHAGKVFSRDQLLDRVWGENVYVGDRTVDVHIRKIREKLGGPYIQTIKGVGYTFKTTLKDAS